MFVEQTRWQGAIRMRLVYFMLMTIDARILYKTRQRNILQRTGTNK